MAATVNESARIALGVTLFSLIRRVLLTGWVKS
jgi:hypothetical protein